MFYRQPSPWDERRSPKAPPALTEEQKLETKVHFLFTILRAERRKGSTSDQPPWTVVFVALSETWSYSRGPVAVGEGGRWVGSCRASFTGPTDSPLCVVAETQWLDTPSTGHTLIARAEEFLGVKGRARCRSGQRTTRGPSTQNQDHYHHTDDPRNSPCQARSSPMLCFRCDQAPPPLSLPRAPPLSLLLAACSPVRRDGVCGHAAARYASVYSSS